MPYHRSTNKTSKNNSANKTKNFGPPYSLMLTFPKGQKPQNSLLYLLSFPNSRKAVYFMLTLHIWSGFIKLLF